MKFFIKYKKNLILILFSLFFLVSLLIIKSNTQPKNQVIDIQNIKAFSKDSFIQICWDTINDPNNEIEIFIVHNSSTETIIIPSTNNEYNFTNGIHGDLYEFTVKLKTQGNYISDGQSTSALFIVYDKLPNLPLVQVNTVNAKKPYHVVKKAPAGLLGYSATENEYTSMQLKIDNFNINDFGEIRVRGNTSSLGKKVAYRIKLDKNLNLLGTKDSSYNAKEWLLLPDYKNFKTEFGMFVSYVLNINFQPSFTPVNLMINEEYLGSYLIVQPPDIFTKHLSFHTDGFIIENDPYWWNSDRQYFSTPFQQTTLRYTIKFPSIKDESSLNMIKTKMSLIESTIINNSLPCNDVIDINSWASWLLVHDILGSFDAAGSNMFLYKTNNSEKLFLGPVWDFDNSFRIKDSWSTTHNTSWLYFNYLLKKSDFKNFYINKWQQISSTFISNTKNHINNYILKNGVALQESWNLDSSKYKQKNILLTDISQNLILWLEEKTVWLNKNIMGD